MASISKLQDTQPQPAYARPDPAATIPVSAIWRANTQGRPLRHTWAYPYSVLLDTQLSTWVREDEV
jgi:hypothetical protein